MRSIARVPAENAVKSYEEVGASRFRGRLCLRTSNNEYNQSFVADRIAKHGEAETEKLLESWMANEPQILGSDVDVLEVIAAGRCDAGLTNHYYLARELKEDPDFPVTPAWPEQDGAGAHANISGAGVVATTDRKDDAQRLVEFLVRRPSAQREIAGQRRVRRRRADVPPGRTHPRPGRTSARTRSTCAGAGERQAAAVALMEPRWGGRRCTPAGPAPRACWPRSSSRGRCWSCR